jgi:AraC-like DNA-binding protein
MNLRSYPWQVRMRTEGDVAIMQFEEAFSLGPIRPILLHIFFGGVIALAEFMMEDTLPRTDHEFTSEFVPDPAFVARFRDRLPRIRDGIGGNAVRFARAWLDKPMRWSDPVAHREAVAMLDEQQRMLLAGGPLPDRVRGVFTEALSPLPSAAVVAARLGMSLRSLNRRLQEHGTSFQALRDEARRIRAVRLLQSTAEPVEAIAAALGYANAAGFHRAFRRWTGVSPGDFRDGTRSSEAGGPLRT